MAAELLQLSHITKSYAGVRALQDVCLTICQGEIWCLVGENGSGKSTLIKAIAGVVPPDAGEITIDGRPYPHLRPIDAIREGIQVIYQDFSLFPNMTVAENIALNNELAANRRWVNWRDVQRIAREALAKIHVSLDLGALVEDLSVADKQLVAISRALVQGARLIIMDEPTTALTRREVLALFAVIRKLQQNGMAILFVSHKLNEVFEISQKVAVMRNGQKVAEGPAADFDNTRLVQYMTGREIRPTFYEQPARAAGATSLLRVEHLSLQGAFEDVSFELYRGEILGITGLLGCGRTELALALFGEQPAESGTVYIDGKPVKLAGIQQAISHGIGYVPEDRLTEGLFLPQPIGSNVVIGKIDRLSNRAGIVDRPQVQAEVEQWVKQLSIVTPSAQLPAQSLSGGNQQRVVLAKWLAIAPRILILNGPTMGVDIGSKTEIHEIIRGLARQGLGILIISDDIPELLQNCNRILVMRRGRVAEELPGRSITESELARKLTEET